MMSSPYSAAALQALRCFREFIVTLVYITAFGEKSKYEPFFRPWLSVTDKR